MESKSPPLSPFGWEGTSNVTWSNICSMNLMQISLWKSLFIQAGQPEGLDTHPRGREGVAPPLAPGHIPGFSLLPGGSPQVLSEYKPGGPPGGPICQRTHWPGGRGLRGQLSTLHPAPLPHFFVSLTQFPVLDSRPGGHRARTADPPRPPPRGSATQLIQWRR